MTNRMSRGVLLLLCFILASCTLPTADSESEIGVSGAPVVNIASPFANASYAEGVAVIIQASISNAGEDISRVDVSVDDALIASQANPNPTGAQIFSITQSWQSMGISQHVITVTAFRTDESISDTASVTINVIDPEMMAEDTPTPTPTPTEEVLDAQSEQDESDEADESNVEDDPEPTDEPEPTDRPEPTDTPEPTNTPEPTVPTVPIARFNVGSNVRSGPGINFAPPIGTFAANATTEILAQNLRGDWYKVRFNNGEGWVLAELVTVEGNVSSLPREAGPPTPVPTPVPPTAIPTAAATATAVTSVNLTFANDSVSSAVPPVCNQQFTITVTIVNNGTAQSPQARVIVEDVLTSNNEVQVRYEGGLLPTNGLAPGQTHTIVAPLTVSTFTNQAHYIRVRIDPDNQVAESNEGDNEQQLPYTLQQGSCP